MGVVLDWTQQHVLYPNGSSLRAMLAAERDPRAYFNWLALERARQLANYREGGEKPGRDRREPRRVHVDWSVSLGTGSIAANMYPAKFSFNINAAPDCTNDFVVYALNIVPSATQANIVGLNNLYSGLAGGAGICGVGSATVSWAYRISNQRLGVSPVLSLDGKKVAFVDRASPAVFHVLTWTAGQGTVGAPVTPTAAQLTNLTLTGATSDTLSAPFVDYFNDVAYVGSNNGMLFKITGVFGGVPALAGAPWPIATGAGNLSGPVFDATTNHVFVGGRDGNVYGFTSAGVAITNSPVLVGANTAIGGIATPPIVDSTSGVLYAVSGDDGANAVVTQANTTNFLPTRTAPIGNRNVAAIHAGSFNDPYFSAAANAIGTNKEWFFYVCGVAANPGRTPTLYRVGFSAARVMNTVANGSTVALSGNNAEACSPLTEFLNGTDRLFLSLPTVAAIEFFDISTGLNPVLGAPGQVAAAGGTSGIIIDNISPLGQASSIYFSTLANSAACGGNRCAVKLTQSGLQ